MRRADRLFQILLLLRRQSVTTANELARELEVSERTIYRDVRDLMTTGIPIQGEAGTGYILRDGFEVPPLMFTEPELLALHLGLRMVRHTVDDALARDARRALDKIEAVIPEKLRGSAPREALHSPLPLFPDDVRQRLGELRHTVDERCRVILDYADAEGRITTRTVRPLALLFWGQSWTLTAWCELREAFRSFRLDRMQSCISTGTVFEEEKGKTFRDYLSQYGATPEDLI